MDYEKLMHLAIEEALLSGDDVPVGALIVDFSGNVISRARNRKELNGDPSAHAEIEAIRLASKKIGSWRLSEHVLVVTLEPCVMCAGAISAARVQKLVFGAWDAKLGACGSVFDIVRDPRLGTPPEVIPGILAVESGALLNSFFKGRRQVMRRSS